MAMEKLPVNSSLLQNKQEHYGFSQRHRIKTGLSHLSGLTKKTELC